MRIYLGAAIDASIYPPNEAYDILIKACKNVYPECVMFNPFSAYRNAENIQESDLHGQEYVKSVNESALEMADLAVFLMQDSPSFGVPLEIEYCTTLQKPTVVFYAAKKKPGLYLLHAINSNKSARLFQLEVNRESPETDVVNSLIFRLTEAKQKLIGYST